jgi:hypothetical protein
MKTELSDVNAHSKLLDSCEFHSFKDLANHVDPMIENLSDGKDITIIGL